MGTDVAKEVDRPHKVFAQLDGKENFLSGHFTGAEAVSRCELANKEAKSLGIKTRYIVKGGE